MSTWQIFSGTKNNFRWELSDQIPPTKPAADEPNGAQFHPPSSSSRLPSMADLLLQGCSKLLQKGEEEGAGNAPMFSTGFGKSVLLKQSSIAKAMSVLGDDDGVTISSEMHARNNACGFTNSLFCTGSGKSVDISSEGLVRAKTLLGLVDDNDYCDFGGSQQRKKLSVPSEKFGQRNLSKLGLTEGKKNRGLVVDATSTPKPVLGSKTAIAERKLANAVNPKLVQPEMQSSAPKPPPIQFHTAGGRSLSISSNALERARNLLGEPDLGSFLNEGDVVDSALLVPPDSRYSDVSSNKENDFYAAFTHPGASYCKRTSKTFVSPLKPSANQIESVPSENNLLGNNLIKKFDAVGNENIYALSNTPAYIDKPLRNGSSVPDTKVDNSLANGIGSRINLLASTSCAPLVDISNADGTVYSNNRKANNEKRRLGRGSSISAFKRPRSSKFTTPLNRNLSYVPRGLSNLSCENSCSRKTVSTRYPFKIRRVYIKEYFEVSISDKSKSEQGGHPERWITSDTADKYKFHNESGLNCVGAEDFYGMLVQSGALVQYASKEWVANHYKWIVWKLACYDRFRPAKSASKFLTVPNVLEELKYRYERETNHGHRSAIKRILDGDAQSSSMMVLCISAIYFRCSPKGATHSVPLNGTEGSNAAKVELTDGWYSVDAFLDAPLSIYLAAGKLFMGQKLRLWGAGLCGWIGPVSPLEASRAVSLSLHINGTYRAHWADRLGFCKDVGAPLAFRCIRSNGGPVPWTLVGVTRIYPVLYKEKLSNGESIVRSERMEAKLMQLYNQRRSAIVEGIVSEFQRVIKGSCTNNDSDSEEGAKILKILEAAAEPEVLMAEMSPEQLTSFASYQAKLEATRQLDMEKAIEKALQDAGLVEREVTPFMRVRVVGLTNDHRKGIPKEGIITIWNPTEKQQNDLAEGQAYSISGLLPLNSDSNTLYLQARGSTTKWRPLSPLEIQSFQPFFCPRVSVLLSNLGEVPLSSEFDIAAFVLHVGEVYTAAQQKKQWVFATDSSIASLRSEDRSTSLLAISFSSPYIEDDDSFSPISYNLVGSTVGFHNLIKRAKDQINHLWIAEATENSAYSFNFDSPNCAHLKNAAGSTRSWANISNLTIEKLKEQVLFIIGDCKG